jgi:hypothetical protein
VDTRLRKACAGVRVDEADQLGPMEAGLKHLVTADTVPVQQNMKRQYELDKQQQNQI